MSLVILLLGFIPLALIGLLLFSVSFVDMIVSKAAWHYSLFYIFILFVISLSVHAHSLQFFERHFKTPYHWKKTDTTTVLVMIISALMTFSLGHTFSFGAFLASALVGLIGSIFFRREKTVIYTGSFIGMTHTAFLPDIGCIILASIITGIVYVFSRHSFIGFGGKLGALSLIGTLTSGFFLGHSPVSLPIPNSDLRLWIVMFSLFGTGLTLVIKRFYRHDPIFASSLATLLVVGINLLIPNGFPPILLAAFMMGTFTGMANRVVLPHVLLFYLASAISAVTMIFSQPFLENAGGKLGTLAFIGVLATRGCVQIYHFIYLYLSIRKQRHITPKKVKELATRVPFSSSEP
ncbi:hypothetical protein GCM10012290_00030 [Halolactibacillus alkaliphilus]|uniref:Uncharacterized protein n=1 Tax=Halolactibacillus alkaliphilus TaxID=442899 RepID=A0A511WZ74_9BACI|nr:hypothetical protein [Halolactibacillus alkaliphilus]GEN55672.1 hypothetical protein HAL01_01360 [Halolactibacillus alkaliphilus]GGN63495.1 hypothetical protein GCM10012290_00030 [Halolactibacillus alkaliphilus]SFO63006.1 hypothetical protein SAMN05720591_101229 [Halolactibacillus alkaliphilus]